MFNSVFKTQWTYRALTNVLRHEEEVVPIPLGDRVVQDRAGRGVLAVLAGHQEDPSVDSLLDHDEAEAGRVVVADVLEAVLQLLRLVLGGHGELAVTDAISENDDCVRPAASSILRLIFYEIQLLLPVICLVIFFESFDKGNLEGVNQFLSRQLQI